jgi:hypothetical protein
MQVLAEMAKAVEQARADMPKRPKNPPPGPQSGYLTASSPAEHRGASLALATAALLLMGTQSL